MPKAGAQKNDFHAKKSLLVSQMDNFDKLLEARDQSGLAKDSRDYIRLKLAITGELSKLEACVVWRTRFLSRSAAPHPAVRASPAHLSSPSRCPFRPRHSHPQLAEGPGRDEQARGGQARRQDGARRDHGAP